MEIFNHKAESGGINITMTAVPCGKDYSITLSGGDVPHIGATVLAVPRESLDNSKLPLEEKKNSASASVLCVTGHKEDELARRVALKLSTKWQVNCVVSAGIHLAAVEPQTFEVVENIVDTLIQTFNEWVTLQRENVVLVDENDQMIGTMDKWHAHKEGQLHRAFSVLVFNEKNELLLQRRSATKYHTPLLWTNTCCSHPRSEETVVDAAHRRLREEMGFDCEITPLFEFLYKVEFEPGLFEHEYDHVFIGRWEGEVAFDPSEVDAVRWISLEELKGEVQNQPENFTYWFKYLLEKGFDQIQAAII